MRSGSGPSVRSSRPKANQRGSRSVLAEQAVGDEQERRRPDVAGRAAEAAGDGGHQRPADAVDGADAGGDALLALEVLRVGERAQAGDERRRERVGVVDVVGEARRRGPRRRACGRRRRRTARAVTALVGAAVAVAARARRRPSPTGCSRSGPRGRAYASSEPEPVAGLQLPLAVVARPPRRCPRRSPGSRRSRRRRSGPSASTIASARAGRSSPSPRIGCPIVDRVA